ncbi:hypothetical protein FQR65_LT03972 [Abscondita terminalis]|nr:hypothetical protein FQR65_LT03972 [Abscondita terminalis]
MTDQLFKVENNSSFDWKQLQIFLFSEYGVQFQVRLEEELQNYPDILNRTDNESSIDEQKRISAKAVFVFFELKKKFLQEISTNAKLQKLWIYALYSIMPSAGVQFGVANVAFSNAVRQLGTETHLKIWKLAVEGKVVGGFCLTEIGHGSNARMVQTTASFDKKNNEFILNTPNFEAAKCWASNVGIIATHAIVYAQLIMPDGKNEGVTLGDMGAKIGLNGIDNGFILFNNYRIPKTCLLNKMSDIDEDGRYVRRVSNERKQFGVAMSGLTKGRITIIGITNNFMCRAIALTLRLLSVKKYNDDDDAGCMLDHQYFQRSLFPYLTVAYVTDIIIDHFLTIQNNLGKKANVLNLGHIGIELHAITSGVKALTAWDVRNGIQKCSEALGNHKYMSNLTAINDVNLTYEGDCHVLIQQTSNWLLKLWPIVLNRKKIDFPLESINFINDSMKILEYKFNCTSLNQFLDAQNILVHFRWLICFLLKESYKKFHRLTSESDAFWAKNNSQVYFCKTLAIAYVQMYIIQQSYNSILKSSDDVNLILNKVLSLYGVWCLEKNLAFFYKGGYASSGELVKFTRDGILWLCDDLKKDVPKLVNAISLPNSFTNLLFGCPVEEVEDMLRNLDITSSQKKLCKL